MTLHLRSFDVNGVPHQLLHINSDDSRAVTTLEDPTAVLLRFDCCLNILRNGEHIGSLFSFPGTWHIQLTDGREEDTGVAVNDYHWKNIELAEVEAAKRLLSA